MIFTSEHLITKHWSFHNKTIIVSTQSHTIQTQRHAFTNEHVHMCTQITHTQHKPTNTSQTDRERHTDLQKRKYTYMQNKHVKQTLAHKHTRTYMYTHSHRCTYHTQSPAIANTSTHSHIWTHSKSHACLNIHTSRHAHTCTHILTDGHIQRVVHA